MLNALQPDLFSVMADDKQFFKALGERIATLRKEAGLIQQTVADQLGVAQQTYAHYEVGRVRMPASLLPEVAALFGVGTDELLGVKNGTGRRGPTPLLQKQIERLTRLPKSQQKIVIQMLDGVLSQSAR